LEQIKILVIGDSCTDVYVYGNCERLCPDAPVPVFVPCHIIKSGGMAANVCENLNALNLECDVITNKKEIEKKRLVEKKTNHMIIRIDSSDEKVDKIKNIKEINLKKYAAIVISDYDKGFLDEDDIQYLCKNHPLTFMDTKKRLGEWCEECTFIKINEVEFAKSKYFVDLYEEWIYDKLIITTGSEGCLHKGKKYPVKKVDVKDLSGAGDTFLAGLVCEYLRSGNIGSSIIFANECATIVVQKKGVCTTDNILKGKNNDH